MKSNIFGTVIVRIDYSLFIHSKSILVEYMLYFLIFSLGIRRRPNHKWKPIPRIRMAQMKEHILASICDRNYIIRLRQWILIAKHTWKLILSLSKSPKNDTFYSTHRHLNSAFSPSLAYTAIYRPTIGRKKTFKYTNNISKE